MNKGMFFRRKEGRLYCVWLNSLGKERCRVVGDASMSNDDGCIRVGELGLDKLISKPDAIKATFGEVLDHYLAQGKTKSGRPKAESTKEVEERNARLYLRPQWAKRIAKDIQPLEVQEWLDALGLEDRNKIKSLMSAVYRHGQKYGMIPRGEEFNPMKLVSCSTVSDYEAVTVTPQQAFAIVEGVDDPLVRTLLILIASTAMRVSEALALAWSDIDWKKCQINIRRAWVHSRFGPPKSKSSKAPVPLHQTVAATLQAWRMETSYAQDDDLLFTSSGKTPRLASMLVEDYVRPAAIAAGVIPKDCPRFGFHNLRHSLCTFLLEAEHDPLVVQRLLRHSDVKMTMQYGHLDGMRRKMQDEFMQEFMPTGSEAGSVQ